MTSEATASAPQPGQRGGATRQWLSGDQRLARQPMLTAQRQQHAAPLRWDEVQCPCRKARCDAVLVCLEEEVRTGHERDVAASGLISGLSERGHVSSISSSRRHGKVTTLFGYLRHANGYSTSWPLLTLPVPHLLPLCVCPARSSTSPARFESIDAGHTREAGHALSLLAAFAASRECFAAA